MKQMALLKNHIETVETDRQWCLQTMCVSDRGASGNKSGFFSSTIVCGHNDNESGKETGTESNGQG